MDDGSALKNHGRAMTTIGFIVNPIAGMGGRVGLKGTDGQAGEARERGAIPVAPVRAAEFLKGIKNTGLSVLTCSGSMGGDALEEAGIRHRAVFTPAGETTSAEDTRRACREMLGRGMDLLVFCGGDGTARDVLDAVGRQVSVLGIPAGVKMYSAVFATTPSAAAAIIRQAGEVPVADAEVVDVDETEYRKGILSIRLYGYAVVPTLPEARQACKWVAESRTEAESQGAIADFIREIMRDDTLYLLGAGTTTAEIARSLGVKKTLLGVDALYRGTIVGRDLGEREILSLLDAYPRAKIVISPIGAQGFVLGRGNQQISAEVLSRVGTGGLVVVATPRKLERTPVLWIDVGDRALEDRFGDFLSVVCGYRMAARKPLRHG